MTTDYSKMEFNPMAKGLFKQYPNLGAILKTDDDKLARFVLLLYDKDCPLHREYPDVERRKVQAAQLSGIGDNVEKYFTFTMPGPDGDIQFDLLLNAVTNFLQYKNSRLWSLIVVNTEAFFEYQRRIMAQVGGEVDKDALSAVTLKTKLLEAIDQIHRRLERYYEEMTGGDKNLEGVITNKRWSPEAIASAKTN
jgi:hypothetical protein